MFDINPIIRALIEKKKKTHTQKYFDMDLIMWTAPALSLLFQNENNLEMCLFNRKGTELLPLNTFLADKIMTHIFQMQERNPEGLWVNRISNMRSTSGTGFSMRVHACVRVEVVCGSPLKNHNCVKTSQKATVYNCKSLYLSQKNRLLKAKWGLNMTQHWMHKDLNGH